MNNRRLRRTLAALALTAAALLTPAAVDDVLKPQQDTTWGADALADTTWGTPATGTGTVAPADTTW